MQRRDLLLKLGLATAGIPLTRLPKFQTPQIADWNGEFTLNKVKDEAFWKAFKKKFYDVSDDFINLENGYFGVHPIPVTKAYMENIQKVNRFSSQYMRTDFNKDAKAILNKLAEFSGVKDSEILITRNATEAMNIIIQGLPLQKGDEVILSKLDYPSMIETFEMLVQQKGIVLRYVDLPLVPNSEAQILEIYNHAVTDRTKCILLTHVIHLTGMIMPIKTLAERFKPKGIDVIVDAAHSFAQLDYRLPDLEADFIGVNLHKWFSNPLGAGMLYVKKERIKELSPLFGDHKKAPEDIHRLGHFGTLATPNILTLPTAQEFNETVTLTLKEQRLRYLQNYWTKAVGSMNRVQVTTPIGDSWSCALGSFKIDGLDSKEVVQRLFDDHQVFTVIRYLPNETVVRVTPNLYNGIGDLDQLINGIKQLAS